MHEAGLAVNILDIVERTAKQEQLTAIKRVVLEIGEFSGVVPELLRVALDVIKKDTLMEAAEFEMLTPPLLLHCRQCEAEYLGDTEDMRCPVCMGEQFDMLQGHKMLVKTIIGE